MAFGNVPGEVSDEDDDQNDINFNEFTKELSEKSTFKSSPYKHACKTSLS